MTPRPTVTCRARSELRFSQRKEPFEHSAPRFGHKVTSSDDSLCYFNGVKLADCVAQHRVSSKVQDCKGGRVTVLNNASDFADRVASCPVRYVLHDDLTTLCADLAFSKGARVFECADLIHVPGERVWVEWCDAPWQGALERYRFPLVNGAYRPGGRRGALIDSSPDGRRGLIRTFWNSPAAQEVAASSVEAYFDLDTFPGEEPQPPDRRVREAVRVTDQEVHGDDVLGRCFRFRYEQSWSDYYHRADLPGAASSALWRQSLGTIALDVPIVLAFLLLLATRTGLPQRQAELERLNRARLRRNRAPLLDHIEVRAPLLPECANRYPPPDQRTRQRPRLHHVRGHLVRRGSSLYWRVPHLRGSARSGIVRTRTVVWTFDPSSRHQSSNAVLANC